MRWQSLVGLVLLPVSAVGQSVTATGGKADAAFVVITLKDLPKGNYATSGDMGCWVQRGDHGGTFIVPQLKAGESLQFNIAAVKRKSPGVFEFKETAGEHIDLTYGDRPVLRYVNKPHDPKNHYLTFKPFHQLFDPAKGEKLLTSGAHPNTKDYLFPHHRGLFFGFNRISYGDKQTADIWHGTNNVFSTHSAMLGTETGEVYGRHTAAIAWHGQDGKAFASERRTVTVYSVPGGTLLDWSTELSTELPSVKLDGDPQHAGFHFRATQEVSKSTAKQTYFLRPDGKGKDGETRNWDAKGKDPKTVNLPWNAMSFVTHDKRYTALRMVHPDNPKESRGSERDYGRFGDYFEYELKPKQPLKLHYRIWLQEGEMTIEQCAALYAGFTQPITARVEK